MVNVLWKYISNTEHRPTIVVVVVEYYLQKAHWVFNVVLEWISKRIYELMNE